ncbi:protein translocase subunit SecF [Candidatus Woesearchaeota archaeon]|nr:protein translocase subunit SecF [Candidatus Woesearchaeota archaeon]
MEDSEIKQEEKIERKDIWKKKFSLKEFYDKNYKKLLIIPFLMLILAVGQILLQTAVTGDFINKGVSLKGGLTVSIDKVWDVAALENYLNNQFPRADISVRALSSAGRQIGIMIEAADVEADELMEAVQNKVGKLDKDKYSVEVMGSSLGASFFKETFRAVIIAFLFMGIVVFLYFRIVTPSIAVILAAFSDIIVTLAIVNVIGMRISTAGIAAFLMLIGYSVDTDILLSTRVLKRKSGTVLDGILSAMKTGLTMSVTTLIAIFIALIFAQSLILKQIMIILLIGLLVDLPNTWIQNAGILRWHLEKKKTKFTEEE